MRPDILTPLFACVQSLPGVGGRGQALLDRLTGGTKILDLLWHLPNAIIDRRFSPQLKDLPPAGSVVTLVLTVEKQTLASGRGRPSRVHCTDGTGTIDLVYFHARGDHLTKLLPIGEQRVVSGTLEYYNDQAQMVHPDYVEPVKDRDSIAIVEPVYPLTGGLHHQTLRKTMRHALTKIPELPEWLDPAFQEKNNWPDWKTALTQGHHPKDLQDVEPETSAHQRLAFDELLANQLALGLVRLKQRTLKGLAVKGDGTLRTKILNHLPFDLTASQHHALKEIYADMGKPERMLRLLQGDVGSGKTIVAFLSLLNAIEAGFQTVLMVPTEILAGQHFATLRPFCEKIGIKIDLLTGRCKGVARAELLERLKAGDIHLLIGTHAVFQKDIAFKNLACAVIDEQHRFGVHQRLELSRKGQAADVLVMTATPIPRTLTLTLYGDMKVSRLTEKPAGRKPVETRVLPQTRLGDVVTALQHYIQQGARVYWVCPLVEESEKIDLAAAEDRFQDLNKIFKDRVGLVHGRMKDKDSVLQDFIDHNIDILVATTVIEVGVDVPEATVMVIEHAERFGLAQLHQLRGRIGRGQEQSFCLLLYAPPLTETAKQRLEILRETEDGFVIAEKDLKLRGSGDVLGTKQSGLLDFRLADLSVHENLLAAADDDAKLILHRDPDLQTPRGKALRTLLYLFERDSAIQYLRSG